MPEKDHKKQLVDYIKSNLKKGYKKESLKWALVEQGHSKLEIQRAFEKAEEEISQERPVFRNIQEPKMEIIDPSISNEKKKGFFSRLFG